MLIIIAESHITLYRFMLHPVNAGLKAADAALEGALQAHFEMTKATSLEKLEYSWTEFLIFAQRVYSKLLAGSKKNINSKRWMKNKIQFKQTDPLLKYLQEARNVDEHCFTEVIQGNDTRLIIGGPGQPVSPEGPFVARELGGGVAKSDLVVKLVPVKGRDQKEYFPTSHLGSPLSDPTPPLSLPSPLPT